MLALRRDLVPPAYIDELQLLHDQLSVMDFDMVRATIEAEFGEPLSAKVERFIVSKRVHATLFQTK